jgi:hypothetical protein
MCWCGAVTEDYTLGMNLKAKGYKARWGLKVQGSVLSKSGCKVQHVDVLCGSAPDRISFETVCLKIERKKQMPWIACSTNPLQPTVCNQLLLQVPE